MGIATGYCDQVKACSFFSAMYSISKKRRPLSHVLFDDKFMLKPVATSNLLQDYRPASS